MVSKPKSDAEPASVDWREEVDERTNEYRGPSPRTQSVLAYLIVTAFVLCIVATVAVALWGLLQGRTVGTDAVSLLNAVGAVFGSLTGAVVVFYFRNIGDKS
ncbi:MAG: hypothetical protein WC876_00805 [Candidatus Thermoplasmatota archaeon]|jgi:hypothetical protein